MPRAIWRTLLAAYAITVLAACSSSSGGDSAANTGGALINGNFALAYVKRPVAALGNPTDNITFSPGGDLYWRDVSSPSAEERNLTVRYTQGAGDVTGPEISPDGRRIVFAMRGPQDPTWDIWEYVINTDTMTRIMADSTDANAGDDIDPAYLPDGRIVFVSNRQTRTREQQTADQTETFSAGDEDGRAPALVLHTMDGDGRNIRQISFNQSHDRQPTVLRSGEIMYSRWDHVGPRNQMSIYHTDPDGTGMNVLYGAHSPGASFAHAREMQDGRIMATLMPLSGSRDGGALVIIDIANFSDDNTPAPGITSRRGQRQPTLFEVPLTSGVSRYGRFSNAFPLWDDTARALVSWTPTRPEPAANALTGEPEEVEGTPAYGLYLLNLDDQTLRPIVTVTPDHAVTDAVAVMPRGGLNVILDTVAEHPLGAEHTGILNVKSVYDTDTLEHMGAAALAPNESIPMKANTANDGRAQVADLARLKDSAYPAASRPARFARITRAVPLPPGLSRALVGETPYEMQQILGYTLVEPDGSVKVRVPADTPLTLSVLDAEGRAFGAHTNWLQVRYGETRTCNGCHSPLRGAALNVAPLAGEHPTLAGVPLPGLIHVHPGVSANGKLNAVDPEGDPLTFRIVDPPSQGTVVLINASTGDFTYTARDDAQIGKDTFTFIASDGTTDSNLATFTVNVHETPRAHQGESMAETRVRVFPDVAALQPDLVYIDVWGTQSNPCIRLKYTGNTNCADAPVPQDDLTTLAPRNGVINYPDHIQPLWSKDRGDNTCTRCHNNSTVGDPVSVGLDLSDAVDPTGRMISYQRLLLGAVPRDAQGLPNYTLVDRVPKVVRDDALVQPGAARASYLIEKIFQLELLAPRSLSGMLDHSTLLNRAEKRLITEWIDIGAQYYNDPYGPDSNNNGVKDLAELRTDARGLDGDQFVTAIYPILQKRCVACHRAASSDGAEPVLDFTLNRYVLNGDVTGDYYATMSMVNDVITPESNPLLVYPRSGVGSDKPLHPLITTPNQAGNLTPVLDPNNPADANVARDYQTIMNWIDAARPTNVP